jgi:hypothetical protein
MLASAQAIPSAAKSAASRLDPFLTYLGRYVAEIDLDIPQMRGPLPPWILMQKHLLNTNYDFARAYYDFLGAWPILRQRDPVLIYQMGKVGSSTIKKSLAALESDRPVYQIHHLTEETIAKAEAGYGSILKSSFPRTKHLLWSRYLLAVKSKELAGPPWKLITLVRDPLAVCISGFFFSNLRDMPPVMSRSVLAFAEAAVPVHHSTRPSSTWPAGSEKKAFEGLGRAEASAGSP